MRKRRAMGIAVILMILLLYGCTGFGGGNTDNLSREIGESTLYTPEEINDIMDIVVRYFEQEFAGCSLTELRYDEEFSDKYCQQWAEQYGAQAAVVLTSSFDVDSSGGDGSLNPNDTYTGWQWILTRDGAGEWTLQTWGY